MFLRKVVLVSILTWFSLTVVGYGIYKAIPIILGPEIVINTPKDGDTVSGTSISVTGTVKRATSLYINSIPIAFTEDGFFQTRLAVYPGSNILIVEAHDRFGRKIVVTENVGTKQN